MAFSKKARTSKRKTGPKYRKRKVTKMKSSKPSKTFKAKVLRVVRATEEVKSVREIIEPLTAHNSVILNTSDWYRCYPQMALSQGFDGNERVGNLISPKRLQLTVDVSLIPADSRALDMTVILYVLKSQKIQGTVVGSGPNTQFPDPNDYLMVDGATSSYFNGVMLAADLPFNKSVVKNGRKYKVRLAKSCGLQTGRWPATGPDYTNAGWQSDPTRLSHRWKINLPTPKVLKYEPSSSSTILTPTNDHWFYAVGYYYNTIGTPADVATVGINVVAQAELRYTDV